MTETCPNCAAGFLLVAGGKKNPHLKCGNETCSFTRPYELPEGEDGEGGEERGSAAVRAQPAALVGT